jgi:hypothetical protein
MAAIEGGGQFAYSSFAVVRIECTGAGGHHGCVLLQQTIQELMPAGGGKPSGAMGYFLGVRYPPDDRQDL